MKSTQYSEKTLEHFRNPRNVGTLEGPNVAVGRVGNPVCGDLMDIYIDVEDDRIKDIKFQTFGCGSAVATSSMITELVVGMQLDEALKVSRADVADALDGLPPIKMHCSNLAADAMHEAIKNWRAGIKPAEAITTPVEKSCHPRPADVVEVEIANLDDYKGKGVYTRVDDQTALAGQRGLVVDACVHALALVVVEVGDLDLDHVGGPRMTRLLHRRRDRLRRLDTGAPVLDGLVHGVGGQVAAVHLDRRQAVERVGYVGAADLECLIELHAHHELGDHARGRDCRAAAEGLELDVLDAIVLDVDVDVHQVTAHRIAHTADGDVGALERAYVARVAEVLEGLLAILGGFHEQCLSVCMVTLIWSSRWGLGLVQRRESPQAGDHAGQHGHDAVHVVVLAEAPEGELERAVRLLVQQPAGDERVG